MKKKHLTDRIMAAVEANRAGGSRTWFDRLPDDVRGELADLKASWQRGEIDSSARGLAKSIVAACREDGHSTCNVETMRAWLSKD